MLFEFVLIWHQVPGVVVLRKGRGGEAGLFRRDGGYGGATAGDGHGLLKLDDLAVFTLRLMNLQI